MESGESAHDPKHTCSLVKHSGGGVMTEEIERGEKREVTFDLIPNPLQYS